jgi:hypothetical protein
MAFVQVLADDRSIYAISGGGALLWYRDGLRDGTNGAGAERGWAPGSGSQIGIGWAGFRHVFCGGGGVIYAIRETGELVWYRDDLRNGTNGAGAERGWAARSGSQIGFGWDFPAVFSPGTGDGLIYAISADTSLLWYRDDLRDGSNGAHAERGWAANSGSHIGIGWAIESSTGLEGYAVPLSVAPGGTVDLKLSAREPSSRTVDLFRLVEQPDGSVGDPVTTSPTTTVPVAAQPVPVDGWQDGCHWATTTSLTLDPDLPSGLYSARCTAGADQTDVVFVVRPAGPTNQPLLVLANTNCWNAYNAWGGRSNYTGPDAVVTLSFERPNPETRPSALVDGQYQANHLTAGEVWLLSWLEKEGYAYDVCSDADLHDGLVDPADYQALVLSTHPEYWSHEMAVRLQDHLAGGRNLLYLGGNGMFRTVEYSGDGSALTTGSDPGHWCAEAWSPDGPFPRSLLGVAYDVGADGNYPQRCGFVVESDHPFLAGTALQVGDHFATQGRNGGGACGWEVDTSSSAFEGGPTADGLQVIARGELVTAAGYGGQITYHVTAGGGFVFAVGSITVTGSLGVDSALDTIVRNALDAALA